MGSISLSVLGRFVSSILGHLLDDLSDVTARFPEPWRTLLFALLFGFIILFIMFLLSRFRRSD